MCPTLPQTTPDDSLLQEMRGPVLWLTLNRPARKNALIAPLVQALQQALAGANAQTNVQANATDATQSPVRAIVLTGAGEEAFCSGADLRPGSFSFDYAEPYQVLADLMRTARRSGIPIIGRINGLCLAGGMGLLALCDVVVASPDAYFGLPEAKVGLFPVQVLAELQHLLPRRILNEMCIAGRRLSSSEALHYGLINHVAPQAGNAALDATLEPVLAAVLQQSPQALRRGLYTLKQIDAMPFEAAMAFTESQLGLMTQTADFAEGVMAFVEKRAPKWVNS
jgi:enoyl-CoA hydratase/carnithine racemase